MDIVSAVIVIAVIAAIGYALFHFKIGPFAPKAPYKSPMQRMGKEPRGPRTPPPAETPNPELVAMAQKPADPPAN